MNFRIDSINFFNQESEWWDFEFGQAIVANNPLIHKRKGFRLQQPVSFSGYIRLQNYKYGVTDDCADQILDIDFHEDLCPVLVEHLNHWCIDSSTKRPRFLNEITLQEQLLNNLLPDCKQACTIGSIPNWYWNKMDSDQQTYSIQSHQHRYKSLSHYRTCGKN